jgi:hypothetical protein
VPGEQIVRAPIMRRTTSALRPGGRAGMAALGLGRVITQGLTNHDPGCHYQIAPALPPAADQVRGFLVNGAVCQERTNGNMSSCAAHHAVIFVTWQTPSLKSSYEA